MESCQRNPYARRPDSRPAPLMQPSEGMRGMRSRVAASTLLTVGWLSFVLLYAAFWATGFSLLQSIVIVLVSLLVLGGILGAMWASWGMRFARVG